MADFTNQPISSTYERVLQIDGGEIQNGLGQPVDGTINSLTATTGFVGDLTGTATTASYVETAQTASYVSNAISSSYALTASYALNGGGGSSIDTGSFATTGSNIFTGNQTITGSVNATNFTGSLLGTATNTDNVGIVIDNTTGTKYVPFVDTSSGYDNLKVDTGLVYSAFSNTLTVGGAVTAPAFNGLATNATNVNIGTTSLNTNYYVTFGFGAGNNRVNIDGGGQFIYNPSTNTLTVPTVVGDLTGTATTASYVETAQTASYVSNAISSSYALSASYAPGTSQTLQQVLDTGNTATSSIDIDGDIFATNFSGDNFYGQLTGNVNGNASTATSAQTAQTASYVETAQTASYVETAQTASYVLNAVSASFATTASHALISDTSAFATSASYATSATLALSASHAGNSDAAISSSYALSASYVPSGLPAGGTTGQILVKSSGTDYDASWSDPANLPFVAYAKDADQDIATAQIVTFPSTPILSAGDSFGSMASTGIYTFTQTGNYLVTINFNTSEYQTSNYGDLDIWGRLNASNDPRYTQLATNAVKKGSVTEVIPITASSTTFDWWSNNSCTVYGTGGTKTRISIVKLN